MKKRILATILCVCIVIGAVGATTAQARWTNTSSISLDMSLSSGTMSSEGTVFGKAGTTMIEVTFTLEKLVSGKYSPVDSWQASSYSMFVGSNRYTSSCTSGTYKLSISGTVTKDGYAEPIEDWLIKSF